MTDGINTDQWFLSDKYKSGLSDVWKDPASGKLSVKTLAGLYYVVGSGSVLASPYGNPNAVQLTYPQLFNEITVAYNAYKMQQPAGRNILDWIESALDVLGVFHEGAYSHIAGVEKDNRLDAICTQAKTDNIRIYAIGFEVTDYSASVMQNCASTPSHFFRVDGLSIADAFASIANDISKLRLTQ
jgi:hypothetical protein